MLRVQPSQAIGTGIARATPAGSTPPPSYTAQATAYFAALATAGVYPTVGLKAVINSWYQAGIDDGWLAKLAFAGLPVWGVEAANRINLIDAAADSVFNSGWAHGIGGVVNGVGAQGGWDSNRTAHTNTADGFFWSTYFPAFYEATSNLMLIGGQASGAVANEFSVTLTDTGGLWFDYPLASAGDRTEYGAGEAQDFLALNVTHASGTWTRQLHHATLSGAFSWSIVTPAAAASSSTPNTATPTGTQFLGIRNDGTGSVLQQMEMAFCWWAWGKALTTPQLDSYGSATAAMLEAAGASVPFWELESEGGGRLLSEAGNTLILT